MNVNQWFALRHPDGFPPQMFEYFKIQCQTWRRYVEERIARWDENEFARMYPKPEYEFSNPTLSGDKRVATLPFGSSLDYHAAKVMEEAFPWPLFRSFPTPFRFWLESRWSYSKSSWIPLYYSVETIRISNTKPGQGEVTLYIWHNEFHHWFYCWTTTKDELTSASEDIGPCGTREELSTLLSKYWQRELVSNASGQFIDDENLEHLPPLQKYLLVEAREMFFKAAHTINAEQKRHDLYLRANEMFEQVNTMGYTDHIVWKQWEQVRDHIEK